MAGFFSKLNMSAVPEYNQSCNSVSSFQALFWSACFQFNAAMTPTLTQQRCGWRADRTLLECSRGRLELSEVCLLQSPTLDYQSTEVSAFLPRRFSSYSTRVLLFSHRRAAGWLHRILFQSLLADLIRHLWSGVSSCVLGFGTVAAVDPFRDAALWSLIPGRKSSDHDLIILEPPKTYHIVIFIIIIYYFFPCVLLFLVCRLQRTNLLGCHCECDSKS